VPLPTPLPTPLPVPLPTPLPVTLPCDVALLTPLVQQAFSVSTIQEGTSSVFHAADVAPGRGLRIQVGMLPSALSSTDPLMRLLLSTPIQFALTFVRDGSSAAVGPDVRLLEGSTSTASPQVPAVLRFLPKPALVQHLVSPPAPGSPAYPRQAWRVDVRALVAAPNCSGPVDVLLASIPFQLLPIPVPAVAFLFDARSYESGFFVTTPGIAGITDGLGYADDKHNQQLRHAKWTAIKELVEATVKLAVALSGFGPPFPTEADAAPLYDMLAKADRRVTTNSDVAIIVGDSADLGKIWLWWGASCNDLASSLFIVSVPNGPVLTTWFDPDFKRPDPPPAFRVPDGRIFASLSTLWSLDTDTARPLNPDDYSAWFRGIGTGNFAYNEISSYRWL